jgi:TolA-binding protein
VRFTSTRQLVFAVGAGAAAVALALPWSTLAEPRPAAKDSEIGKKATAAPDASMAGSIQARGKSAEPAGPALDFETFRYTIEIQVSSKRREEMADLDQLIRLGGSDKEMPGWLFRVAELHWEEAQYYFFEANRKDDAIAAAKGDPTRQAQLRAERKELSARSASEQEAAISRYRDIARRFPKYPRLDEVVFFLGENLWKQNRRREALDAYKALITRFPKSKYVPDAWMAYGEFYFDGADKSNRNEALRKALESYKRAAAFTESSVYGYALYKQAWVHYNLGAWSEALDLFRAVIFFGDLPTSTIAQDKKLALAREARKDYVRTYSHVGSPRAAPEEFARVGGKDAREMLKSLAGLYYDEGKDHDAILVYHGLIQADPASYEAPLFQGRIVTCAGRMGKKELAVQQAGKFVDMLRDAEKRAPANADDKAQRALSDARRDAENTLRTLAVQYHTEYKKTRDDPVAALAAELYRRHLEVFPTSKYAYEMRFFHAELLYALEKFAEAGAEYTQVAQMDVDRLKNPGADGKPQKAGKYMVDALESAVQSYDIVAKRSEEKKQQGVDAKARQPLPPNKKQLVDACQFYLANAPRGDKRVEIAYKAARVYYEYNNFAEAIPLFVEIAEKHPKHELARYAANLALDCYNIQGDPRGMNALAKRLWSDGDLMRAQPVLREDLAKVIEESAFKLVEELERGQRYGEAADAYVSFVHDWPGSKLAPKALFNASVDLVRAGRLDRAMVARDELMKRYPNDPLAPKIIFTNAQDREAVADFGHAAEDYERYFNGWYRAAAAQNAPAVVRGKGRKAKRASRQVAVPHGDAGGFEEAKARDALYNAGVLREGLSQHRRAEDDRLKFVETWPTAPESPRIFLSVADLYGRQNQTAKEIKQLEDYQEQWARDPTEWLVIQDRIARLHAKAGDGRGEQRAYEDAQRYWRAHRGQVGERGMPVVAQAEYLALEPAFEDYAKIDFGVPAKLAPARQVKWLRNQVGWKAHKLEALQKSYTAVVNLKQAEPAVCALYKIGLGYKNFAHTLQSAPLPKEIRRDKAMTEEYRNQLNQLAEAPEKKAVEALEFAMTKSRELGVSNACSKATAEALAKYKPDLYGPTLEKVPELDTPPSASTRPQGRGLLTSLVQPTPRKQTTDAASALPPLGAPRTASTAKASGPARDPDLDPTEAVEGPPAARAEPVPVPSKDDEDLLP